jgi:plasmid stabilization system protein ParE
MPAVRWAPRAVDDLERIFRYLEQSNPAAARRVVQSIYDAASSLQTFPERGRLSRRPGARELVCAPWPSVGAGLRRAGPGRSGGWGRRPVAAARPWARVRQVGSVN